MRLRVVALLAMLMIATACCAWAASARPDGVDLRIDHLSNATLLSTPATALVDPDRQAAAHRFESLFFPGWAISILAQVVVLAYFWRSGHAARLRDFLRRGGASETVTRFRFGAVLGLIARLAALLPEFYIYRLERMMSLNDQLLRAWGSDWIVNTIITMIVTGIVIAVALWLVDRTHQWYLYLTALVFIVGYVIVFVRPYAISPFFDRFTTLPPAASAIASGVEAKAHLHVPVVMQMRTRTHLGIAYVEGLGGTMRVVLGDALPKALTPGELSVVIANQLGYIANGDPFRAALLNALSVVIGAALAVAAADRIGFRRDDDPLARLALVGALLGVTYLLVLPFNNAALRRLARENSTYAMQLTGDRVSAVRGVIRGTDQGLHVVCPDVLERIFLDRVDSPSARVSELNGVKSGCP